MSDKSETEKQLEDINAAIENDELTPERVDWLVETVEQQARELEALRERVEQVDVQLAGCGVAALGGTKDVAKKGDYGWSASYQDVLELRLKFEKAEAERDRLAAGNAAVRGLLTEALRKMSDHVAYDKSKPTWVMEYHPWKSFLS